MPENVLRALNRFGFKDSEIKLYLLCVQNPEGLSVADLTQQGGFKRSTVNLMLERLQKQGFITYHLEGARKRFLAESPQVLLSQFEDSLDELKSLIPLLAMSGIEGGTKVRFFEGRSGLEKMFADILLAMRINRNPKKEILLISSGKDIFDVLPDHQKQFIDKRVKTKIPTRWIAPDSPVVRELGKKSVDELRQLRFFDPKKYRFNIEIDIYGKNVAFMSLSNQPTGVIIENAHLAESFTSLFNLIWDASTVKSK